MTLYSIYLQILSDLFHFSFLIFSEDHLSLSLPFPFFLLYFAKIFIGLHSLLLICLFPTLITFSLSSHEHIFNSILHIFVHIIGAKSWVSLYHNFIFSFLTKLYDDASYENHVLFLVSHMLLYNIKNLKFTWLFPLIFLFFKAQC